MRPNAITKAGILSICAVVASVVLTASVAQEEHAASKTSLTRKGGTLVMRPTIVAKTTPLPKKGAPYLVADALPTIPQPKVAAAPTLLPIVNQTSIHANQQKIADTVLRILPAGCRNNLKNFMVRYDNPDERGLGGKTTIIIAGNEGDEEFAGLLIHECGHVISANLQGNTATGPSGFKDGGDIFFKDAPVASFFAISWTDEKTPKKGNKNEDFVSGYASSDIFEDFAETFTTYVLQRPSMVARAQTNTAIALKLAWMEKNLPMPENAFGVASYRWDKKVPWDSTKLAYTWNP